MQSEQGECPAEWLTLLRRQARPRQGIHVTDCLSCPRRKAGLAEEWPVQLDRLERRLEGSLLHMAMAEVDSHEAEVPVTFEAFGTKLVGSIDRLSGGRTIDYKDKGSEMWKEPDGPYEEEVWQQEAYRLGLARSRYPVETAGWTIWYRWQPRPTKDEPKPRKRWARFERSGPLLSEVSLGRFRPHAGAYTVQEIVGQLTSGLPAAELPLAGSTQKIGGRTACDYCEVEEACKARQGEVDL